jgi:DNA-binding MarR family transcriptional regulator
MDPEDKAILRYFVEPHSVLGVGRVIPLPGRKLSKRIQRLEKRGYLTRIRGRTNDTVYQTSPSGLKELQEG